MQTFVIEAPLDKLGEKKIKRLNNEIGSGKHTFIFLYMVGCGPCNSTKEPWSKIHDYLGEEHLKNPEIVVAMVDKDFYPRLKNAGKEPMGFPTLRYIGNELEEYENAEIEKKDRSAESFADWIKVKVAKKGVMKGGKSRNYKIMMSHCRTTPAKRRSGGKNTKKRAGGKWSLKYKQSINCKRPKGFSQRQHCKYGRTKKNRVK